MTIGERIKKARKALGHTQQAFADRLGMKQNTIATYEMNRTNPSDPAIKSICREFNINETWLRIGKGEMFIPSPEESIDELVRAHDLDDLDRQILLEFIKLKAEDRDAVKKYVRSLAQHISPAAPAPSPARIPSAELTIEQQADQFAAKAAELAREQFLAEKRRESEASSVKESGAG